MRVLLAPDKFKGTLSAAQVAGHLARGLVSVDPTIEIRTVPVADGGDGLLDAVLADGFQRVAVEAAGPDGASRPTSYAVRRGEEAVEAVVEMAEVCGLALVAGDPDPMGATSLGVGQVMSAALDAGADRILLGIGGSASTDGGAGVLRGLGARILGPGGAELADGGGALGDAVVLDLGGLHPALRRASVQVACDVDNPLTGPHGAAEVYGPQKGADAEQVSRLDAALTRWADLVAATVGRDLRETAGAGAAGGVGFGALACLGADLRPGAGLVQALTGLAEALDGVDLVVTGEGSLDEQTLHGKAPAAVAATGAERGLPVVAVAGRCLLDGERLRQAGFTRCYVLDDRARDLDQAMNDPGPLLEAIGADLARDLRDAAR